jgi:hypothetical protein
MKEKNQTNSSEPPKPKLIFKAQTREILDRDSI